MRQVVEWAIIGLVMIVIAFSVAYFVQAKANYRDCVDRNERAVNTDQALSELANAMEMTGDAKEAEAVRKFRGRRQETSLPECDRPPFTARHEPPGAR